MKVGEICSTGAVSVGVGASLADVVERMCNERVGCALVTRTVADYRLVVGILTDRDILRAQIHRAGEFSELSVEEAMSRDPLLVSAEEDSASVLGKLRARGVRRAPVIDAFGQALGLVSVDDLLQQIARDIDGLSAAIAGQSGHSAHRASTTAVA